LQQGRFSLHLPCKTIKSPDSYKLFFKGQIKDRRECSVWALYVDFSVRSEALIQWFN